MSLGDMLMEKRVAKEKPKEKKPKKAQGSIEYIMMVVVALIIVAIVMVFLLGVGGKSVKGGGLHATLLEVEASTTSASGNTIGSISVATNLPLDLSLSAPLTINGTNKGNYTYSGLEYNVSGAYEYVFTLKSGGAPVKSGSTITSMNVSGSDTTSGTPILLLPSGKSVTVESGTAPFSLNSLG